METSFRGRPDAYLAQAERLLQNPTLVTEAVAILKDPTVEAEKLVRLIQMEPGLSSKILRMANSALFGMPKSITSLKAAVVRLGNKSIAQLVLAASLGMGRNVPNQHLLTFWKHSISVAWMSRRMAEYLRHYTKQEQDEFFSMGLLHDIGVLIFIAAGDFDAVQRIVVAAASTPTPKTLEQAEIEFFGFDHGQLGLFAANKWNFPGDLVHAIGHHHHPEKAAEYRARTIIIHLADIVCHGYKMPNVAGEAFPPTKEEFLAEVKMPLEQLGVFGDWLLEQQAAIETYGQTLIGS